MKIAIPIWDGKVSPVFDTATRVMILDCEGAVEKSRDQALLGEGEFYAKCRHLKSLGVNVLICGAISARYHAILSDVTGIRVIPWVSGLCDEVARRYLDGKLDPDARPG